MTCSGGGENPILSWENTNGSDIIRIAEYRQIQVIKYEVLVIVREST